MNFAFFSLARFFFSHPLPNLFCVVFFLALSLGILILSNLFSFLFQFPVALTHYIMLARWFFLNSFRIWAEMAHASFFILYFFTIWKRYNLKKLHESSFGRESSRKHSNYNWNTILSRASKLWNTEDSDKQIMVPVEGNKYFVGRLRK